ncbi:arylamine N-acetyltransferase [Streptomyces abikoensis]|uniref:arylamine N-acetyltransferase n=1 Tax=Streptomyces abikoensis TaxID=97398 RepID=UPI00371F8CF6
MRNHCISTHPHSPFVSRLVVQRTEPGLRRTLVGSTLTNARTGGPGMNGKRVPRS